MSNPVALSIANLSHRYDEHTAIHDLSLEIQTGEIFILLGPNGSGKTTLFRVLSTLIPLQAGEVHFLGHSLKKQAATVRSLLGVLFQAPSSDKKLTVLENLRYQGHLYGLSGRALAIRIETMLSRLGLSDRKNQMVEKLSGGLRRRVELAQSMLHNPKILLLDEPSTGLDPGARIDLWEYLYQIQAEQGITIVATTHILEEAERATRIGIMHQGNLAALDTPRVLCESVGGDSITISTQNPEQLCAEINQALTCDAHVVEGTVRLERPDGHQWLSKIAAQFPNQFDTITLGKPTLEDVFIARTGHRFWSDRSNQE